MSEVLHIKSSAVPKLRCFDRKTKFILIDGTFKHIEELKPLDILIDGTIITSKIKVTSKGLDMYKLDNIIVSESHVVKYDNKWIQVKEHPYANKISGYTEPYLYCLNTSTKIILLNNTVFTDWDEVYDDSLEFLLNYYSIEDTECISKIVDCGFNKETQIKTKFGEKSIDKICIGEVLSTGGIVYGIVELTNNLGNEKLLNLLVSNEKFEISDVVHFDYNNNIDCILKLNKNII